MGRVAISAQDFKLVCSFETVRETLLRDRYSDRLAKPLAYWALPNDRRLPLAFLSRSIGELVNTPFEELSATPGIGQKKISSLVKLLMRATRDQPPAVPFGLADLADERGLEPSMAGAPFDAFMVSEVLWSEWTQTVRQHNLGGEKLGRVARSLRTMPTVIWARTLDQYVDLTLADIRNLRTHGEKRVRCVLQAFHTVHERMRQRGTDTDLDRLLGSPHIVAASDWVKQKIAGEEVPQVDEARRRLTDPILRQIEIDCGRTVYRIARHRLGIESEAMSVRSQAQRMGVTRARVYQLLDDCHKVMEVRWPTGKSMLDRLTAKFGSQLGTRANDLSFFLATRQLCFPERSHAEEAVA